MSFSPHGYLAGFTNLERGGPQPGVMSLDRIRLLLAALGEPHIHYRSVLIAGTKGKGSTAAMIERGLRAAGYRTGLYTQPHLHTIRERVRVNGVMLIAEEFASAMERVKEAAEGFDRTTTAYELMTALALDWFATREVDVAVLEVGLGGRLDATNVVDADVSVLTSISLDHTQILGDTVELIAREKADILKPGRPAISAPQPAAAMEVIRAIATDRHVDLHVVDESGSVRWDPEAPLDLQTERGRISNLRPALQGEFQRINIPVAVAVLECLDRSGVANVPVSAVRAGIESVEWPGRFEVIAGTPPIVIDGAHNVESATLLRSSMADAYPGIPTTIVLGIMADKDVPGIMRALLPCSRIIAVRANHPRAVEPHAILDLAAQQDVPAAIAPTVAAALATARATSAGVILVTGSLYVVAEAREALGLAQHFEEETYNPWASLP